jgi:nitrate reductase delta subunit
VLKLLAVLLAYPDDRWRAALPELRAAVAGEPALKTAWRSELAALLDAAAAAEPLVWEAAYTATFDQGRATSLHVFEHLHGDSRERGMALVVLKERYAEAGLALTPGEMPDALPVLLEYFSMLPAATARAELREAAPALRALGQALVNRGAPHAAVLRVLLAWLGEPPLATAAPSAELPLDAEWAEAPVSFAAPQGVVAQVVHWVRKR